MAERPAGPGPAPPAGPDGDPDRTAVYTAETAAAPDGGRRFARFVELERVVGAAMTEPWWEQQFPDAPVSVELHRRS
ncbi:MAG TPA: hypothetical protein PK912_01730, partial [Microthrixaceae bacterium]|nr:hypothetical protein [Microthrixaceae bacterium]